MWLRAVALICCLLQCSWSAPLAGGEELPGRCWSWPPSGQSAPVAGSLTPIEFVDLLEFTATDCTLQGTTGTIELPLDSIWRLEFARPKQLAAAPVSLPCLVLANGDRWNVHSLLLEEDQLAVTWQPEGGPLTVPLEAVSSMTWGPADQFGETIEPVPQPENQTGQDNPAALPATSQDELTLRNGDRLSGELLALTQAEITFRTDLGELVLAAEQLRELRLSRLLLAPVAFPERLLIVQLTNGSRVSVSRLETLESGKVKLILTAEQSIVVPKSQLASIDLFAPQVRSLTWQPLLLAKHETFFGEHLPLQLGGSVAGGPLTLADRTYALGLGVRSASELTFELPAAASELWVWVGLDDRVLAPQLDASQSEPGAVAVQPIAAPGGRVEISLVGKLRGSGELRTLSAPTAVSPERPVLLLGPISLVDCEQITLLTQFGPDADLLDIINWCVPTIRLQPARPVE